MNYADRAGCASASFTASATQDDVYYCYRLLLGREPDANGFETYSSVIASRDVSVDELVKMFLSSVEFRNRDVQHSAEEPPVLVQLAGFRLLASPADWAVGKHIIEKKTHEPHVTEVMRSVLRPGMTVLDIGANIGYFTLLARSIIGAAGRVYAFEPDPRNCTMLQLSLAANGFENVEVFPFALADSARLFIYDTQGSNGTITPFDGDVARWSSRTVIRSVALDDVLTMERCDVLKIDVEGAEALALRGAARHIRAHHPIVFSEFSPPALRNVSGVSGEEYLQFLFLENYSVSVISPLAALEDCGQDAAAVMQRFEAAKASHIDILATPPGGGADARRG